MGVLIRTGVPKNFQKLMIEWGLLFGALEWPFPNSSSGFQKINALGARGGTCC